MPDYAETTIRIGADTGLAEAALGRVSRGFDEMQARTMPGLQRAFGATSTYAIRMTGVMSSMGIGAQALTGPLGAVAHGLSAIHPAFLLVAMAGGLVTGMLMKKKEVTLSAAEAMKRNEEAVKLNVTALDSYLQKLKQTEGPLAALRDESVRSLEKERAQLKEKIDVISPQIDAARKREYDALRNLSGAGLEYVAFNIAESEALKDNIGSMNEYANRLVEIESLLGRMQDKSLAPVLAKQRDQLDELALEYEVWPQRIIGIMRSANYDLVGEMLLWGGLTEAEWMAKAQEASAKAIALDKQRYSKAQELTLRYQSFVFAALQREMNLRKAISASLVALAVDEVAKRLEAYAVEWAKKALGAAADALMGHPGAAAAAVKYAAAAAAAGAGAVVVRGMAEQGVYGGPGGAGSERIGEGTTAVEQRRTVLSQGPITLNYSAIMTIQGSVYDTSDLRLLWNQWNLDQLRTAGIDAAKRSKG